jgi:hypothetical protein
VVLTANITITTFGRSMFRHESGPSYNVLGIFPIPVKVMLLPSSMMLCMSLVGVASMEPIWVTRLPAICQVGDLETMYFLFTYEIQLIDGLYSKIWGQVQVGGRDMLWLHTGHGFSCLEENRQQTHRRMKPCSFMSSTLVRTFCCHYIWTSLQG